VAEANPKRAPVPAIDKNRRRQILHQHELATAHVAPIGLQQEGLGIGGDFLHGPVIEQPAIAAVGIASMCRCRNGAAFDTWLAVREKTLMSPDQPILSFRWGQSDGIVRKLSTFDQTRFDQRLLIAGFEDW